MDCGLLLPLSARYLGTWVRISEYRTWRATSSEGDALSKNTGANLRPEAAWKNPHIGPDQDGTGRIRTQSSITVEPTLETAKIERQSTAEAALPAAVLFCHWVQYVCANECLAFHCPLPIFIFLHYQLQFVPWHR